MKGKIDSVIIDSKNDIACTHFIFAAEAHLPRKRIAKQRQTIHALNRVKRADLTFFMEIGIFVSECSTGIIRCRCAGAAANAAVGSVVVAAAVLQFENLCQA